MSKTQFLNTLTHLYSIQKVNEYTYPERHKAWQAFEKLGLPTAKSEEYKHIHNRLVESLDDTENINHTTPLPIQNHFYDIDAYHIAIVNGVLSLGDSHLEGSESQFSINLDTEIFNAKDIFLSKRFLDKQNKDPFLAINNSLYNQDIHITLHEDVAIEKPLIIYFINQSLETNFIHPRICADAKAHSKSEIIISYHDQGIKHGFINSQSFFHLHKSSCLDLTTLQTFRQHSSKIINNTICVQNESSTFDSSTYSTGEILVRNNLIVELKGQNAETNLYGLSNPTNTGFIDNHTTIIHNAEHTHSNELYRHIIDDKGTAIFNGEIYVCKDAQKTQAFQTNDSILLSDTATVHAKPQLEIFADDVKCSHGATVGQLNVDEIFYLRARGIPENAAKALLIDAFAGVVIEKLKNKTIRQILDLYLK